MATQGRRRKEPTVEELYTRIVSLESQLKTVKDCLKSMVEFLSPPKKPKTSKKRQPVTRHG